MRSNNPCWPDCPDETENKTCRPTCRRWKEYEAEKRLEYQANARAFLAKEDYNDYISATIKRMKRGKRKHG